MIDWSDYKRTNVIALAIIGVCVGHPQMANFDTGSGGELEELDNAFDDAAYIRGWEDWQCR